MSDRHAHDGLIVVVGGETWGDIWGSHRHLAEALSRYRPVLYVDQPISVMSQRRGRAARSPGLHHERPGLTVLVPAGLPGFTRPGIRAATLMMIRRALRRTLADLGSPRVAALVVARPEDLFDVCPADTAVLYATDDFTAGAELMGVDLRYLQTHERRQADRADRVVVVSEHLARKWRALGHDPVVIENGCDPETFAAVDDAPPPNDIPARIAAGPVAGMVGRLSARIDLAFLEAVADDDVALVLVGPRHDDFEPGRVDGLLARPNVTWVGPKRFDELPSYLRIIDVGLTPYADTEFNRASFPLKVLEYLAAGRASVTSDLPATRSLPNPPVQVATDAEMFRAQVRKALDRPRTPELMDQRREVARQNSWDVRARRFLATMVDAPGTVRP